MGSPLRVMLDTRGLDQMPLGADTFRVLRKLIAVGAIDLVASHALPNQLGVTSKGKLFRAMPLMQTEEAFEQQAPPASVVNRYHSDGLDGMIDERTKPDDASLTPRVKDIVNAGIQLYVTDDTRLADSLRASSAVCQVITYAQCLSHLEALAKD